MATTEDVVIHTTAAQDLPLVVGERSVYERLAQILAPARRREAEHGEAAA